MTTPVPQLASFELGFERMAQAGGSPVATSMLHGLLDRLEEALDEETTGLEHRTALDFTEISRRKSRSLLELSRATRALPQAMDGRLVERLARLRGKLLRNQELLGIHLAAAQEVAGILGSAIRYADSDGTYSSSHASGPASR